MAYIGVSPSNGVRRVHTYTATASQTTFSGAGAEGTSLSYKDSNFVDVYQNGVKLGDADYTATSGTSIVLAQGASVSDLVVVVVFDVFSVADTVSKADGGTFDGNVTMAGTLTGTTATFSTADNNPQLTLVSTDADENVGPEIDLYRNSASPADGDILGRLVFNGENDADEKIDYANIQFRIADASDGTEDAKLLIVKKTAGADVSVMASDATETVFNDGSVDLDFRVESNNNANMLFVDGADDRVGIGTSTFGAASHKLEVDGGSGETRLRISSTGTDLREAGIIWLGIGIESGDKNVRLEVSKGKFEDVDINEVVGQVEDAGINVMANYIFGLPTDTHDSMRKTQDLAIELATLGWNGYSAMPLPGSQLYKDAVDGGWQLPDDYEGYSFHAYNTVPIPTDNLTSEEILKFRDEAYLEYHKSEKFLSKIKDKYGQQAVDNILKNCEIKLKRKLLGD